MSMISGMARHTWQIIWGTVALTVGTILGQLDTWHGARYDAQLAVAFAVYTPGLVLLIVGLIGYAGSLPLITGQPQRRGRARGWIAVFVLWTLLAAWMAYGLVVWIIHRLEGQPKPHVGVLIFSALVLVGLIALARHALRRARKPPPTKDGVEQQPPAT